VWCQKHTAGSANLLIVLLGRLPLLKYGSERTLPQGLRVKKSHEAHCFCAFCFGGGSILHFSGCAILISPEKALSSLRRPIKANLLI
jgi:hypothetical protein